VLPGWSFLVVALAGCSFTAPRQAIPDDVPDDATPDTPIDTPPPDPTAHLLITEVMPFAGADGSAEFIEILNPTAEPVALESFYLSDDHDYWRIPEIVPPAVQNTDFLCQFPAGATIAPGAVIVVAVNGPDFLAKLGVLPTFTLRDRVDGASEMIQTVPTTDLANNWITDTGEMVALFRWDEESDLIQDVDIVVHGNEVTPPNRLIAKTAVDGPDRGLEPTGFQAEALTLVGMTADALPGQSYKRVAREAAEARTGGNGLTGHDETSEAIAESWNLGSAPATPFDVPAALR
jgi:hypothetical protein